MADCGPFRLYVGENIEAVVAELRQQLRKKGAMVTGSDQQGTFSAALPIGGMLSGSYAVAGKSLEISISNCPDVVSCGTIESKMQDFILDAKAVLKSQIKT